MTPDWANGIMMLAGEANSTLSNSTDPCEQEGGGFQTCMGGNVIWFFVDPSQHCMGFLFV